MDEEAEEDDLDDDEYSDQEDDPECIRQLQESVPLRKQGERSRFEEVVDMLEGRAADMRGQHPVSSPHIYSNKCGPS